MVYFDLILLSVYYQYYLIVSKVFQQVEVEIVQRLMKCFFIVMFVSQYEYTACYTPPLLLQTAAWALSARC